MKNSPSARQSAARHPIIEVVLHPAITLVCLLILFTLIFFGTLYQTEHGLFEAQKKFFGYGLVLIGEFFPLPAASLVLWVLSIQLAALMAVRLPWKPAKAGLWVVHLGIMSLLVGGFITQVMAVESQLTLAEGEEGQYSTSYQDWELAFWETSGDSNRVLAFDAGALPAGTMAELAPYRATLRIAVNYPNCDAFTEESGKTGADKQEIVYLNASNVAVLEARKPEKEVTQNVPGLLFTLSEPGRDARHILLYGAESQPLSLMMGGRRVFCQLRLKHYPMNFSLKLTDFVKNVHPGTDVPSSFESYADLREQGGSRQVKVWMNNPLRHQGYTFFQASYVQPPGMAERSTFAVVTNPGRVLPYVSSLVVFVGLLLHFLLKLVPFIRQEAV